MSEASRLSARRRTPSAALWEPTSNSWSPATALPGRSTKIRRCASSTRTRSNRIKKRTLSQECPTCGLPIDSRVRAAMTDDHLSRPARIPAFIKNFGLSLLVILSIILGILVVELVYYVFFLPGGTRNVDMQMHRVVFLDG